MIWDISDVLYDGLAQLGSRASADTVMTRFPFHPCICIYAYIHVYTHTWAVLESYIDRMYSSLLILYVFSVHTTKSLWFWISSYHTLRITTQKYNITLTRQYCLNHNKTVIQVTLLRCEYYRKILTTVVSTIPNEIKSSMHIHDPDQGPLAEWGLKVN